MNGICNLSTGKSRKNWRTKPKWFHIKNQASSKEEKQTGALSYPVLTKISADITLSGIYSIWYPQQLTFDNLSCFNNCQTSVSNQRHLVKFKMEIMVLIKSNIFDNWLEPKDFLHTSPCKHALNVHAIYFYFLFFPANIGWALCTETEQRILHWPPGIQPQQDDWSVFCFIIRPPPSPIRWNFCELIA